MRSRILSSVLTVLAAAVMFTTVYAASEFKLVIDGTEVTSSVKPVIDDGVAYVPLEVIADYFGADVSWNATRKQAYVETAAYKITVTLGASSVSVNGATKTVPKTAKIISNAVMMPLKTITDIIGASAEFDAAENVTNVSYFTKMGGALKIDGSTTLQPIAQAAADRLMEMNKGLSVTVAGGGSGTGIKDAQAGTVNIGMSSRELTEAEQDKLNAYAVANDGIAIIVNPANTVRALSVEQAKKIFLGEIKNWKDVGAAAAPIIVMTRETGSGTRATLEEMILNKASVVAVATPFTSSALIKQAVAKDKNAIGFDSIGFVDATVKAVSLNGKTASPETVIDGAYPLSRQLYCCTKGRATGLAAMFIDYLKTKDCQENIVEKEGYVKLY